MSDCVIMWMWSYLHYSLASQASASCHMVLVWHQSHWEDEAIGSIMMLACVAYRSLGSSCELERQKKHLYKFNVTASVTYVIHIFRCHSVSCSHSSFLQLTRLGSTTWWSVQFINMLRLSTRVRHHHSINPYWPVMKSNDVEYLFKNFHVSFYL